MLRVAVIGVGSMGQNHARVYRDMDQYVDLVGVADQDETAAARIGSKFGVPYYTDYLRLIDTAKPELVSLAVPTSLHYSVGCDLIQRGIHVLIEKPIASTIPQGELLIELAEKHNVTLAVGHIERFNPAIIALREKLDSGMAGQIFKVQAQRLSPFPARIRDAGVVIDLASHDIDLFRYLIQDEIIRLFGETRLAIGHNHEDMFVGVLRFRNGAVGVLDVNWMTPVKVRNLTVTAALGMFQCNLLSQELFFYENRDTNGQWDALSILRGVSQGDVIGYHIKRHEPLAAELLDFVVAVQQGTEPKVTGRDALQTLRAAIDFIDSGRDIRIQNYMTAQMEARV
jgi:UDP-N-acetylglucosamine 3-dehydrogenase